MSEKNGNSVVRGAFLLLAAFFVTAMDAPSGCGLTADPTNNVKPKVEIGQCPSFRLLLTADDEAPDVGNPSNCLETPGPWPLLDRDVTFENLPPYVTQSFTLDRLLVLRASATAPAVNDLEIRYHVNFPGDGEFDGSILLTIRLPDGREQISVTNPNPGSAMVTSEPPAISCGNVCAANFAVSTQVELIAAINPGYEFRGWTGACAGEMVYERGDSKFIVVIVPPGGLDCELQVSAEVPPLVVTLRGYLEDGNVELEGEIPVGTEFKLVAEVTPTEPGHTYEFEFVSSEQFIMDPEGNVAHGVAQESGSFNVIARDITNPSDVRRGEAEYVLRVSSSNLPLSASCVPDDLCSSPSVGVTVRAQVQSGTPTIYRWSIDEDPMTWEVEGTELTAGSVPISSFGHTKVITVSLQVSDGVNVHTSMCSVQFSPDC